MQLRLQADEPLDYKAGHILGFEMVHPESGEALKGPYTVTRPVGDRQFDIIYRVIPDGRKTPFMQRLAPGDTVRFGGRFGKPVDEGVAPECDRFVGVATGAGLGPLVGYAEAAFAAAGGPARIELYCGFRDLADVCGSACDALAERYPDRFVWTPVISKPIRDVDVPAVPSFVQGRVSMAVPALLGDAVSSTTHFHLVGNGQFVVDFQKGLLDSGVAEDRVTTEKYFGGKAMPDTEVASFVASAIHQRLARAPQPAM